MFEIDEEIEQAESLQSEEDDYSEAPPSDIVAFNELRSCADLVRMYNSKQLDIQPEFQRDIVWNNAAQTRFIDSLVKQLPIPSMCLSLDYKTDKRLMIDGLQRISSIIKFSTDNDWRLSSLEDVDSKISGRLTSYIKEKHSDIFGRIENLTIPITVLRCDYTKKSHMDYLFTIFHRLNTGGNKLNNQEIRNCIYQSDFNAMLIELVKDNQTKQLFSINPSKTYRFGFEELLLRAFTFSDVLQKYNGRLAKFLNDYMNTSRKLSLNEVDEKKSQMLRSITLIYERILDGQSLPKLTKAFTEALLVGVYSNVDTLENESADELRMRFISLRNDEHFSLNSLKEGLSGKDRVINRIGRAIEIFR